MKTGQKVSSDAAFTVVEIMILVSIIALLLAISIPSYNKQREQAVAPKVGSKLIEEERRYGSIPIDQRWFLDITNVTVVSNHRIESTSMYDVVVAYGSNRYTFIALSSKQLAVGSTGILEVVRFKHEPRGTDQHILFVREKTD